jgi:hypothetical protein
MPVLLVASCGKEKMLGLGLLMPLGPGREPEDFASAIATCGQHCLPLPQAAGWDQGPVSHTHTPTDQAWELRIPLNFTVLLLGFRMGPGGALRSFLDIPSPCVLASLDCFLWFPADSGSRLQSSLVSSPGV